MCLMDPTWIVSRVSSNVSVRIRTTLTTGVLRHHPTLQPTAQHRKVCSWSTPPPEHPLRTSMPNRRLLGCNSPQVTSHCSGRRDFVTRLVRARSCFVHRLGDQTWHSQCVCLSRRSFQCWMRLGVGRWLASRRQEGRHVKSLPGQRELPVCGIWFVQLTPIAVDPSLMASNEYSTWKRRPSGEKVLRHVSTFYHYVFSRH